MPEDLAIAMPYVFLTSNASMAFPEAVEACMQAGLDSLKWSVNACDEAQFEDVMGVSGKLFHRALDNIAAAWDTRQRGGYATGLSNHLKFTLFCCRISL